MARAGLGPWVALAGLFIGAGLFFGLRASAPSPPVAQAPPTAPIQPVAPAPEVSTAAVAQQVAAQLEAQRARFIEQCWKPAVAKSPTPAGSSHVFQITVDREGREVMRAIADVAEQSRPEVGACLRDTYQAIAVPPPMRNVAVDVTLTFP